MPTTRGSCDGGKASKINDDCAGPELGQRRDRRGCAAACDALLQVDQPYAGGKRVRQLGGQVGLITGDLDDQSSQLGIRRIVTQQVSHDPVRHPQPAGQHRSFGVLDDHQALPDQRPARLQSRPGCGAQPGHSGQLQRESHGSATPGDVVVEIAVQPLESGVQIRQQGDHEQLDIEWRQPGLASQPAEPNVGSGSFRPLGLGVQYRKLLMINCNPSAGAEPEQQVDGLVGEIEAAEGVVGSRIRCTPFGHELAYPLLHQGGPAQQVAERVLAVRRRLSSQGATAVTKSS